MTRPKKSGLAYFPLDTDFFRDRKVRRLRRTFGDKGVSIYLYLLAEIYRDKGYYVLYEENLVIDVANDLDLSENLVSQVINLGVSFGLFDENLYGTFRILTSRGIQDRYFRAVNRRPQNENSQYILIDVSDTIETNEKTRNSVHANDQTKNEMSDVYKNKDKTKNETRNKDKKNDKIKSEIRNNDQNNGQIKSEIRNNGQNENYTKFEISDISTEENSAKNEITGILENKTNKNEKTDLFDDEMPENDTETQERKEKKRKEKKITSNKDSTTSSESNGMRDSPCTDFSLADSCREVLELFGTICGDRLQTPRRVTRPRISSVIRVRSDLKDEGMDFEDYFKKIRQSPFLTGENDKNWRANFDWVLRPMNFTKVIEGNYDSKVKQNCEPDYGSLECYRGGSFFDGIDAG